MTQFQYQILKKEGCILQSLYQAQIWWPGETHNNGGAGVRTFTNKRIARRVKRHLQNELATDDLVIAKVEVEDDGKVEEWYGVRSELHASARLTANWINREDSRLLASIVPASIVLMGVYFWPQLREWFGW